MQDEICHLKLIGSFMRSAEVHMKGGVAAWLGETRCVDLLSASHV